jgi:O-glycosyl hydrolase
MKLHSPCILQTVLLLTFLSAVVEAQVTTIDLASQQQYIRGFGGMNFPRWAAGDLGASNIDKAFGAGDGQIGLTVLRIDIPPSSAQWSGEIATAVGAKSHGAIVFASPWSPPASMKDNGSTIRGSLLPSSYDAFAAHLNSFCQFMASNGASLYAVSLQNEPDWLPDYESCGWTSSQFISFLTSSGPRVGNGIILAESASYDKALTDPILNDSVASSRFSILGTHIYGRVPSSYPLAESKGKELWMTEHITDTDSAHIWSGALKLAKEVNDCMAANFNEYTWWYIKRFYGLISEDGNVSKRGYAFSHFSRFVRPGYYRVGATANPVANVDVTAYKNGPSVVIVALNRDATSKSITFAIQNGSVSGFTKYTTSESKNVNNEGSVIVSGDSCMVVLDALSITTLVSSATESLSLSVTSTTINLAAEADTTGSFNITSNTGWTLNSDQPWLTVNQASGSNNASVTVSGLQNTNTYCRSANITVAAPGVGTETITVTQEAMARGVWLEAECASVGTLWNLLTDANASNARYVTIGAGNNSTTVAPTDTTGYIDFPFSLDEEGTYYLFARVLCPTPNDDSYWVRMDGGSWVMWNNLTTTSWAWLQFPITFDLSAGNHTLTFAYREDGALLDKINLSTSSTIPIGLGEPASNLGTTGVGEYELSRGSILPKDFGLSHNYPNPFNPTTVITYQVPVTSHMSLKVYDILGQEVVTLFEGSRQPGTYKATFDGSGLPSGVYLCRLAAGNYSQTKKLLLVK